MESVDDHIWSETLREVIHLVETLPRRTELAALLDDRHPSLQSLTSSDVHRIRALVFRKLAADNVSLNVLNEARTELELGDNLHSALSAANLIVDLEIPPHDAPVWILDAIIRFVALDRPINPNNPFSPTALARSGVSQLIEAYIRLPVQNRLKYRDILLALIDFMFPAISEGEDFLAN